ncbi:MAG: hypothetical protein GC189_05965 [Alphaproteobacteria bacterium]|nr:hypothetical protein [Alphaproteobacteria bacterium]
MRNLTIGLVAVALIVMVLALLALAYPERMTALGDGGFSRLTYLLLSVLLVGGGLFGLTGRGVDRRWPIHALFWAALIIAIALLARAFGLA